VLRGDDELVYEGRLDLAQLQLALNCHRDLPIHVGDSIQTETSSGDLIQSASSPLLDRPAEATLSVVGADATQEARAALRLAEAEPERAVVLASTVAQRADDEGDPAAGSVAERAWGLALYHRGTLETAIMHLDRAVRLALAARSPQLAGEARTTLAFPLFQQGRLKRAFHQLDRAMGELDKAGRARALAQRGTILLELGRIGEALANYRVALPDLRDAGDRLWTYRVVWNRGIAHSYRYEFAAAEADMRTAERLAGELGLTLAKAFAQSNLGFFLGQRGDVRAALEYFDRAEELIRHQGAQLGTLLQDRSELLLSARLIGEAQAAADQAVTELTKEGRVVKLPEVRLMLARAAAANGDLAEARQQAATAAVEFGRQRRREWRAAARLAEAQAAAAMHDHPGIDLRSVRRDTATLERAGWAIALEGHLLAAVLFAEEGRAGDSRRQLQAASRARGGRRPATLRARAWYAEALLRSSEGDRRGTLTAARAGIRILDEHRDSLGATDLRAHVAGHRTDLAKLGLRTTMASGPLWCAFEWAERGRASHLLRRAARPPDDSTLAEDLARLRATVRDIYEARSTGSDVGRLVQRQVALERRVRDSTRRSRPTGGLAPVPQPVGRDALVATLDRRALLEFVEMDGDLHGLSIVDGRLRSRRLATTAEVDDLLKRVFFGLRRLLTNPHSAPSISAARVLVAHAAERLDRLVLGACTELGDRSLVIVPTAVLHDMPWSVLPSVRGRPVTVSPSATMWHRATVAEPARGRVLIAAGPHLPGAEQEASVIGHVYGVEPLLGAASAVGRVLAALDGASLGHLATHGRLKADNPLFSHLELFDGPLFVHDLEQLEAMPATLVVAACEGGRSLARTGDEVLGLTATLLAQGSTQLVGPVLPIPDLRTAPLMASFHRLLTAGVPPAEALATTQEQLVDSPTDVASGAAFVCFGAGYIRVISAAPDVAVSATTRPIPEVGHRVSPEVRTV
jgi:tetratricopeptide (TPR) repeat protein